MNQEGLVSSDESGSQHVKHYALKRERMIDSD